MKNRILALLVALAGASAFLAPSADAAPRDSVQHFGNMATGGCLDDSLAYGLRGFDCNGLDFQNWNVHIYQEDGTRQLRNIATGRCIFDNGATPWVRACDTSKVESWFVYARGDKVSFENQLTGKCMDDSEFGLRMLPCTYNRNQTWR